LGSKLLPHTTSHTTVETYLAGVARAAAARAEAVRLVRLVDSAFSVTTPLPLENEEQMEEEEEEQTPAFLKGRHYTQVGGTEAKEGATDAVIVFFGGGGWAVPEPPWTWAVLGGSGRGMDRTKSHL
jgi:acetyl esterase/lipase